MLIGFIDLIDDLLTAIVLGLMAQLGEREKRSSLSRC
jgi:hypothetical protein